MVSTSNQDIWHQYFHSWYTRLLQWKKIGREKNFTAQNANISFPFHTNFLDIPLPWNNLYTSIFDFIIF